MSKNGWLARRWKLVLNIVTLAALVIVVVAGWDQIAETFNNLGRVHAWIILLIIPIEFLNYHAQARLYQRLFTIVGNKLDYWHLFRVSLELNFVNHVFPTGGVTGMSYFTLRLKRGRELSGAKVTLVHVMKLALYVLSFELVLIFGVISLAVMGRANDVVILVASSVGTLLLVATGLFAYIIGTKQRINNFFTSLTKGLNRLIHIVRPSYPETINIGAARQVFEDFHDNYEVFKKNYDQLKAPFWYALLADVTEILAVYVVFAAFGNWVNIGAVILAYAIANFAGMISVLPGGVGIYEALMTTVLAATGVPPSVGLPAVIMYRVLNTVIQIPPGYYFYHKALKEEGQPKPEPPDVT